MGPHVEAHGLRARLEVSWPLDDPLEEGEGVREGDVLAEGQGHHLVVPAVEVSVPVEEVGRVVGGEGPPVLVHVVGLVGAAADEQVEAPGLGHLLEVLPR